MRFVSDFSFARMLQRESDFFRESISLETVVNTENKQVKLPGREGWEEERNR